MRVWGSPDWVFDLANYWLFGLLGLVFGSFFNVCIHRIPRSQSLITPGSHCPRCGKPIRFYDNIPVLSWLILRGRCRDCGRPISIRYLVVELLAGGLFVAAYWRFGLNWLLLKALVFIGWLIVLAFIDLDLQILPFKLSLSGLVLGLAGGLLPGGSIREAFLGAAIGAGFIGAAWLLWRFGLAGIFRRHMGINQKEGMGAGDWPMAAMIGAFVGIRGIAVALSASVVLGVIIGLGARALGRGRRGQPIPYGPFLALGGLIGLFFGSELFAWYVRTMFPY